MSESMVELLSRIPIPWEDLTSCKGESMVNTIRVQI